jgi:hypothetical protein
MKKFAKLSIILALATAIPAFADEYKETLSILRDKGILTQQEYNSKLQAYEEREENKKFAEQRIDKDVSDNNKWRQARANDGSVTENGIGLKSKDGNNTIQLTGRLHMDYRQYDPAYGAGQTTDSYQNLAEVRRARFGVRGQFAKDFRYQLLANFGNEVGASATTSKLWQRCWIKFNYINSR